MNDGAIHGSVAAAVAANLTGSDDAFGLAQEVPVRGHAEVAGALEKKKETLLVSILSLTRSKPHIVERR